MEFMDILMDEAYRFAVVARDFFSEYDYEAGLEAFFLSVLRWIGVRASGFGYVFRRRLKSSFFIRLVKFLTMIRLFVN